MGTFMVFLKEASDHVLQVTTSFEGEHDLAQEDAETGVLLCLSCKNLDSVEERVEAEIPMSRRVLK